MHGSKEICDLFVGDASQYRQFIDELFSHRFKSVVARVPFYRDYLKAHGLSVADFSTISSVGKLPILDRNFIQSQEIERFINADITHLPKPTFTSGTTGAPLKLYASRDFYFSGFYIMQRSYGGSLPFVVACISDDDRILPAVDGCQVHFIARKSTLQRLLSRLVEIKPQIAMLRPDRWRLLCDDYGRELSNLGLVVAGVSAAPSTAQERAYFSSVIGCPVANMYGATELGGGIFECPFQRQHVISHQNYLEILDDNGCPVEAAKDAHMVWTSLDNTIMPFIRYKIGDTSTFSVDQVCKCGWNGPIVDSIGAMKKEAVIFPNGVKMAFYVLNVEIHKGRGPTLFRQYQMVQETQNLLCLKVVKSRKFNENDMYGIESRLRELLRGELELQVRYVEEIEHEENKFRYFVPLLPR